MKTKRKLSPDLDNLLPILIGIWRKYTKLAGPADRLQTREFRQTIELIQKIEDALHKKNHTQQFQDFYTPDLLGAYLLYQWVIHYQQGLSLIGEIPHLPKRVLEICSGAAPFSYAALKAGANDVWAVDCNSEALKLASEVAGKSGFPISVRKWNFPRNKLPVEGKFDLIIVPYCLNELFNFDTEKSTQFLISLESYLTKDGYLMLVDSSQSFFNQKLLVLRDRLVQEGFPVQAPCVFKGSCPALATHTPCFAQREMEKPYFIKEVQRAAGINMGSLKMTYVIFKNRSSSWPTLRHEQTYRVISPMFESAIGQRYYLCGVDGKRNLDCNLKTHQPQTRAFEYLKRGELISVQGALERGPSWQIVQDSEIRVEAALGKSIPEPSFNDEIAN